jgi:(E)-4-hydroxy-3-methylbut-2-enyl-diphosphate synthase
MDENNALPPAAEARNQVMREAIVAFLRSTARAACREKSACRATKIILSAKVSGVQDLIAVYRNLAARCDYPLHLGLTEAGMGSKGIVASTAGIGVLLHAGIGDTIRVSLTPEPGGDRTRKSSSRRRSCRRWACARSLPMVVACPGCGRTTSTYFQELAQSIQSHIRHRMPAWRKPSMSASRT